MLTGLVIILGILTFGYSAAIVVIAFGLPRLRKPMSMDKPSVSVVVAARNEEGNIGALLIALIGQEYPAELYEIIIVDDASTDGTASIIHDYQRKHGQACIRHILVEDRHKIVSPKKHALSLGIGQAKGEIILLTDADCVPPPRWISGMTNYFTPSVGTVIGFSPYELPRLNSLWEHLLALDSLSLAALAAGTAGWARPATCNGRNLAYRKEVFEQVGGFEDIKQFVSGDDDLFLRLVTQKTQWQVRYAYDAELVVPTKLLTSWRQFYHQRVRHASKGRSYGWRATVVLSTAYLYNLLLLTALFLALIVPPLLFVFLVALIVKSLAEFLLLYIFARRTRRTSYLRFFPLAAVLHSVYIVAFGALGQLGKFRWKDQAS